MKLARRCPRRGRVEIIPLIDTVLILLIFYMSFSSFRQKEQSLDVPLAVRRGTGPGPISVSIHVSREGTMLVNGAPFDADSLRELLIATALADPRTAVTIGADAQTDYQSVIRAVDLCAQARLRHIGFRPLAG